MFRRGLRLGVSHKGLIEEAGLDTGYFTPDELYLLRQVREVVWLLLRVLPRRSSSKPPRRLTGILQSPVAARKQIEAR